MKVFEFEDELGVGIIIAENEQDAIKAYKKMLEEQNEKPDMENIIIKEMKPEQYMNQVFIGAGYGE
jgi:hypothetical protein